MGIQRRKNSPDENKRQIANELKAFNENFKLADNPQTYHLGKLNFKSVVCFSSCKFMLVSFSICLRKKYLLVIYQIQNFWTQPNPSLIFKLKLRILFLKFGFGWIRVRIRIKIFQ